MSLSEVFLQRSFVLNCRGESAGGVEIFLVFNKVEGW